VLLAIEMEKRGVEAVRRSVEHEHVPRRRRNQHYQVGLDARELGGMVDELSHTHTQRKVRTMAKPIVRLREAQNGFIGEIEMPCGRGSVRATALGAYPWDALKRASSVAQRISSDPALMPFIPPQALIAIKTAQVLSKLAKHSPNTLRRITPELAPGSRQIAQSFARARGFGSKDRATSTEARSERAQPDYQQPEQPEPAYDDADGGAAQAAHQMPQPYMNPDDPLERYAHAAWGDGAFSEMPGWAPPTVDWSDQYDDGSDVPIYQEDYFDDAES
jgi:hypothetical protein